MVKCCRKPSTILVGGSGVLAGLCLGWLLGGYTSCRSTTFGCEIRVDIVEAVGTWIGGLGTIMAVIYAALTLRAHKADSATRHSIIQEKKASLERAAFQAARSLHFAIKADGYEANRIHHVTLLVKNTSRDADMTCIEISLPEESLLEQLKDLSPGDSTTISKETEIFLEGSLSEWEANANQKIKARYTTRDRVWEKVGQESPKLIDTARPSSAH